MILCGVAPIALAGCDPGVPPITGAVNPFADLLVIERDGVSRPLTADVVPLGFLDRDDVIRLEVRVEAVEAVLILMSDETSDETGVIVGGGPPFVPFDYRVQVAGDYFAFVQFDPTADAAARTGTITAGPGDPAFEPPSRQIVRVEFADGYLADPGLFDPTTMPVSNQAFLESISDVVQAEIVTTLRRIFDGTPIEIIDEHDAPPSEPFSRLRFLPDRVLADEQNVFDAALPPSDPTRPQCRVRVVFGEILPAGTRQDVGNRILDDEAVVYVGSFQGRGETCHTAATDSINNVVMALAQTGAHEIGHLVGLYHVEQVDVMNRSATLAFLRELALARGQIQVERLIGGQVVSEVLPAIVQDPGLYFRTAFAGRE